MRLKQLHKLTNKHWTRPKHNKV